MKQLTPIEIQNQRVLLTSQLAQENQITERRISENFISKLSVRVPKPIIEKLTELDQLVTQNPEYIPLTECASFLGAKSDGLRASIENGQCPFGISWQCMGAANRAFKIPTVTFYMWYTQGVLIKCATYG